MGFKSQTGGRNNNLKKNMYKTFKNIVGFGKA